MTHIHIPECRRPWHQESLTLVLVPTQPVASVRVQCDHWLVAPTPSASGKQTSACLSEFLTQTWSGGLLCNLSSLTGSSFYQKSMCSAFSYCEDGRDDFRALTCWSWNRKSIAWSFKLTNSVVLGRFLTEWCHGLIGLRSIILAPVEIRLEKGRSVIVVINP